MVWRYIEAKCRQLLLFTCILYFNIITFSSCQLFAYCTSTLLLFCIFSILHSLVRIGLPHYTLVLLIFSVYLGLYYLTHVLVTCLFDLVPLFEQSVRPYTDHCIWLCVCHVLFLQWRKMEYRVQGFSCKKIFQRGNVNKSFIVASTQRQLHLKTIKSYKNSTYQQSRFSTALILCKPDI